MASRLATAIMVALPPPKANVVMVAAEVAQPGHIVARTAPPARMPPHGLHMRMKLPTAVSPVASV